ARCPFPPVHGTPLQHVPYWSAQVLAQLRANSWHPTARHWYVSPGRFAACMRHRLQDAAGSRAKRGEQAGINPLAGQSDVREVADCGVTGIESRVRDRQRMAAGIEFVAGRVAEWP